MADTAKVKVRFKRHAPIQGKNYVEGQEVEFSASLAAALIHQGHAEPINTASAEAPPKKK